MEWKLGTHVFTVEWKHGNMCIHSGMETWEHMYLLWNGNMGTHVITVEWKLGTHVFTV